MKTLLLKAKAIPGKTSYRIPSRHPLDEDKDGNLSVAPPASGIQLQIGKETEVECFDARHEQLLRSDEHLEVLDEDGEHAKPKVLEVPTGVSPELFKKWQKREAEMIAALEAAEAEGEELAKANAELRNELAQQDAELSAQRSAIAELEAKLKAAIAALPAPSPAADTKPLEAKPTEVKTEKVEKKK